MFIFCTKILGFLCASHGDMCAVCGGKTSGDTKQIGKFCKDHKDLAGNCIKCGKEKAKATTREIQICKDCKKNWDYGHNCAHGISLSSSLK